MKEISSRDGQKALRNAPRISVFSPNPSSWQWFAADTAGRIRWLFHTEEPRSFLERAITRPRLSRMLGAWRCAREGRREGSAAYAAHSQFSTFWLSIALWMLRVETPLLSFSFHFSELPSGMRRAAMRWAFRRVDHFVVHSQPERERYSSHFGIPVERFELVRWGVASSSVEIEDAPPLAAGSYICAIGKDGRDYRTLIQAARQLPDLNFVIVAQPYNLHGASVPKNVKVFFNIPIENAMNLLKYSQFMALPLESGETSCGHISLVSAMLCHKAIVATRSSGIADYFPESYDAPQVDAGDVQGWVDALKAMASDLNRSERCAIVGEAFAREYCSHDSVLRATLRIFRDAGVDL